jgi:hypothetical protein
LIVDLTHFFVRDLRNSTTRCAAGVSYAEYFDEFLQREAGSQRILH